MAIRKRDVSCGASPEGGGGGPDEYALAYPCIWEHLYLTRYEDGSPRQGSTLLLFCDAGVVKACLKDRDQGVEAWVAGSGLQHVLGALESSLAGDTAEWRKTNQAGKKRR